jgi:hypothetical protein
MTVGVAKFCTAGPMAITPIICCKNINNIDAIAIGITSVIQQITTTIIKAIAFNPSGVKVPETGKLDTIK